MYVKSGTNGKPTDESLNAVFSKISEKSGKGGDILGAYVESDDFDAMNSYAKKKLNESTYGNWGYNKDRDPYSITSNNCATFASDVLKQDKKVNVSHPSIKSPKKLLINTEIAMIVLIMIVKQKQQL